MKIRGAWAASILLLASVGCADDDANVDERAALGQEESSESGPDGESKDEAAELSDEKDSDSDPDQTKTEPQEAEHKSDDSQAIETAKGESEKPESASAEAGASAGSAAKDAPSKDANSDDAPGESQPAPASDGEEPTTASGEMEAVSEPAPPAADGVDGADGAEDTQDTAAGTAEPATTDPPDPQTAPPVQATLVGLGERLFEDKSLSYSGTQSCASCHDAASAFSGNADSEHPRFPVSRGDLEGRFGNRNAPTAMYMQFSPPFTFVEEEEEPGEFTPTGGLFWDGRVSSLSEQAAGPFLNPNEMAQPDKAAVIERVRQTDYVWMFEPLFGPEPLGNVDDAYDHVTDAIAAYERTDKFNPFSSKFDAYLRGEVALSDVEQLGFQLFQDPEKGNCISCHVGTVGSTESRDWLFTDFTYDNLGVPRNAEIPNNGDPAYFDLGLCQSAVVEQQIPAVIEDRASFLASLCGAFKVPTLRNVAKTNPYMHNGYFQELRDVVDFYVTRETEPARWYPLSEDGTVAKYDDLPSPYWGNVNTGEVPYDRMEGMEARLTPDEIDAVVAFLETLTDGYHDESHELPHLH